MGPGICSARINRNLSNNVLVVSPGSTSEANIGDGVNTLLPRQGGNFCPDCLLTGLYKYSWSEKKSEDELVQHRSH